MNSTIITAVPPIVFHSKQTPQNDMVFNTIVGYNPGSNMIVNDRDYNKPDYTQYLFSTMGKGVNAMYPNNMVLPIRLKTTLNGYGMYAEIAKHLGKNNVSNGIYIVEYFTIRSDATTIGESAIDYYLESHNINIDYNVTEHIIKTLGERKGNRIPPEIQLRLVNFIGEKALHEHTNVFVPGPNIVLINGNINPGLIHPNSVTDKAVTNKLQNMEGNNIIYLEIIDNDNTIPYFIKIGNDVHKILSHKDPTKINGGYMSIKKNGSYQTDDNRCGISDLSGMGIYRTYDQAITEGDTAKLAEVRKLELDLSKIKLEYDKMSYEREKLRLEMEHYKEKHELEMHKKRVETNLVYGKGMTDLHITLSKFKIEMATLMFKNKIDNTKSVLDVGSKLITFANTAIKIF
jgi:hypothetical protein